MDKALIEAVKFLLSQHREHFHPHVAEEAKNHLAAIAAVEAPSGQTLAQHEE